MRKDAHDLFEAADVVAGIVFGFDFVTATRKWFGLGTALELYALRWVYTFDAVKRRIRRHALRYFAALAGAFRLASACASVLEKSINPRAYINVGKS